MISCRASSRQTLIAMISSRSVHIKVPTRFHISDAAQSLIQQNKQLTAERDEAFTQRDKANAERDIALAKLSLVQKAQDNLRQSERSGADKGMLLITNGKVSYFPRSHPHC
jgi:hypothetical protein